MANTKNLQESQSFLESKTFKKFMQKLYGWGASVVILGALFKLMHWPAAGFMLTLGLGTEAIIFFISAFDMQKEVDWTRVFPELVEKNDAPAKPSVTAELNKMLESARIDTATVTKLGEGLHSFSNTVSGMKDITNATVATDEFTKKIQMATGNFDRINTSYEKTADALGQLSDLSTSSREYFNQMKSASIHLSSLNSLYEMELNDANKHRESLSKYQHNLASTIGNLVDAESVTKQLKDNFTKLNQNLTSLTNVYGNMLSAMGK